MFLCAVLLLHPAVLYVDWVPHGSTLDAQWEQWKFEHKKNYNGSKNYRRTVWEQNLLMNATHNQEAEWGKYSYKLGMNNLADMIWKKGTYKTKNAQKLPKSIHYRQKGLVTPVKVQGETCYSCWVFSAAGALEGQLAKKTGHLVDLSTQNLLDCVPNMGCNGGHMMNAFMYVQENGGMNSEADYPYVKEEQGCSFKPQAIAAHCGGFKQIPEGDEQELAKALYEVGPLSVAIDDSLIFSYSGGVFYHPRCKKDKPKHAVLLVGYGETAEGEEYWIVKNSWGKNWGQDGYIWMARNRDNHCGIATDAWYPLV